MPGRRGQGVARAASRCTLARTKRELVLPEIDPFAKESLEKEWEFLCAAVSPVADPERLRLLFASGLNWSVVLELAGEHGVLGMLANRLEGEGYAGVPEEAREKLQIRMREQHVFTLGMTAELFRILEGFSGARIETILVKGPVISLLAYGDSAARSYVDLDLLVRHRDIQGATQRMLALGFEPAVAVSAIRAGKIPGEYLFRRKGTQRAVELHTERTFRYYPRAMRMEELFARKRQLLLDRRDVPALSLEDELVLDCVHGSKHFWERLMWVCDVA